MPKASKLVIRQRVEEILEIVLLGGELHDIRSHSKDQGWGLSDVQLWRYQQRAYKLCQERAEKNREKLFSRHLLQRRALYARCMEAGDWRAALAVAKDEAELQALYPLAVEQRIAALEARIAKLVEEKERQSDAEHSRAAGEPGATP